MILADTSAWIEYDRATGSRVDLRLTELIETTAPIVITEPVMMELFSGARDARSEGKLRRLLKRFELATFDSATDFEAAARIFRLCREAGVTPRGLVDCMIASVAMRHGASVLAGDVDFSRIAAVVTLELDPASTRA